MLLKLISAPLGDSMRLSTVRSLVDSQYQNLPATVRVVVIHPDVRAQPIVLDKVQRNAIYVCLHGRELPFEVMEARFKEGVSSQGYSEKNQGSYDVVIDEADRAIPDELVIFLKWVLARPDVGRIFLFTRQVPMAVIADQSLCDQTAFLPTHTPSLWWDHAARRSLPSLVNVHALSLGHVVMDGRLVTAWDGVLPRALFFYLIDKGMATRDEIFHTFWRTLSPKDATNVFHVTKRKMSEVLAITLTDYKMGYYQVSPDIQVSYDVIAFNQCYIDSQNADLKESVASLEQGIWFYRSDYLADLKNDWVVTRRAGLRATFNDMLVALGKAYQLQGRVPEANAAFVRAAAVNRLRENTVELVMTTAREIGRQREALGVYALLRQTLKEKMNMQPTSVLETLAAQLEADLR